MVARWTCYLTMRCSGPWCIAGRVWPRHGHRGRPLNTIVSHHEHSLEVLKYMVPRPVQWKVTTRGMVASALLMPFIAGGASVLIHGLVEAYISIELVGTALTIFLGSLLHAAALVVIMESARGKNFCKWISSLSSLIFAAVLHFYIPTSESSTAGLGYIFVPLYAAITAMVLWLPCSLLLPSR